MSDFAENTLIPYKYVDMMRFGKMMEARFWKSGDIKYGTDAEFYKKLSPELTHITDCVFAVFLPFDGLLNNVLLQRVMGGCFTQEESYGMAFQIVTEAVHAETYGKLAHSMYGVDIERIRQMSANVSQVYKLGDFLIKYCDLKYSNNHNILAQACSERVHVYSLFLFINYYKYKNIMPSFVHANSMIRDDEKIHGDFATFRYNHYGGLPQEEAMKIIDEATSLFEDLIDYMFPIPLEDINASQYKEYLHLIIDHLLSDINLPSKYNAKDPFPWNISHNLYAKENRFEVHSGTYSQLSVEEELKKWMLVEGEENLDNNDYNNDLLYADF